MRVLRPVNTPITLLLFFFVHLSTFFFCLALFPSLFYVGKINISFQSFALLLLANSITLYSVQIGCVGSRGEVGHKA